MKLRYDCPPSSSKDEERPLWQSATIVACGVLRSIPDDLQSISDLSKDSVRSTWAHAVALIEGALAPAK